MKYYYATANTDRFMISSKERCFTKGKLYYAKKDGKRMRIYQDDLGADHEITGGWEKYFELEEIDEATYNLLINL